MAAYTLEGKSVAITGAASGIGLEMAKAFAERGVHYIALLDVADTQSAIAEVQAATKLHGGLKCVGFKADVKAAIQQAEAAVGILDIIVANAGIGPCGPFLEADAAHFANVMTVNYMGVVHTLMASVPAFVNRGHGRIVVTNSIGGFMGAAGIPAYCASKFAVRGLVESLRLEAWLQLLGTGVSIHMACPSFTDTPMIRYAQQETSQKLRDMFAATVPKMLSPAKVGALIVRGVEEGRFIPRSPDAGADLLVSSCLTPCGERPFSLPIDMLLAPLYVLLHWAVKRSVEGAAWKIMVAEGQELRGGRGSVGVWLPAISLAVLCALLAAWWAGALL